MRKAPERGSRYVRFYTDAVWEEAHMLGLDKEHLVRFRKNIDLLISTHVQEGQKVDEVLGSLVEKWNPLFDSAGRRNLVEDVNALVRDFVRPLLPSFQKNPPDSKRIEALAEQLSAGGSLAKIAKKAPLKRYIELYILKIMNEV
jgi:hypothetical protein